ncbi:MAG TPA: DinB family protein [Acidobacteriaceae bacterium]|nr:DinB family protein [Acidobacteriaceae bacterium]
MNPYARQLGSRDPLKVVATTARHLEQLSVALGPVRLEEPPAPGKWSPHEILCHLADCELVFSYRIRQALAEPHHVIQPFDQELWAANYSGYDPQAAMMTFSCVRQWNLMLLRSISPDLMSKPVTHPERGQMTLRTLIETMAGHDLNHLAQLEAIAVQVPISR